MIARNFLEADPCILYPRIDMAGNQTGIIGSEFPFFNYLIYLVSLIFGYAHWYGRLINLLVSGTGTYFFFLLLKNTVGKRVAFNATIVFLCSIWFSFSRKIMPDTFSVSLVMIGLYFCYKYLTNGYILSLLLFFLFATLGMLCKIPAMSLVAVTSLIVLIKELDLKRKFMVLIFTGLSLAVVSLWYFYWVPRLLAVYHYQLYFPKGLVEGLREILPLLPQFFEKFYFSSLFSYVAFAFFLIGTMVIIRSGNRFLKVGMLVITVAFLVFILKSGSVFPLHSYYIIPFTPVMALAAGFGIDRIPAKYIFIPLIIIALEGIANQQHDFFIKAGERYKLTLEGLAGRNIGKSELIVINGGPSPQEIYFAHRKGWTVDNKLIKKHELDSLKDAGASWLIINTKAFAETIGYYPLVDSGGNYAIYRLTAK